MVTGLVVVHGQRTGPGIGTGGGAGTVPGAATACASTFFSALVQLIPCRAAVAPFSPIPPSEACCDSLKALGQPCLCVLVNGPPISGVDRNMAMQLPDKCTSNFEPCMYSIISTTFIYLYFYALFLENSPSISALSICFYFVIILLNF
ncbi:hypothetical protein UlMin_004997 [Ulmus minor]